MAKVTAAVNRPVEVGVGETLRLHRIVACTYAENKLGHSWDSTTRIVVRVSGEWRQTVPRNPLIRLWRFDVNCCDYWKKRVSDSAIRGFESSHPS